MALTIVTEPALEPVTVADINDFLRITDTGAMSDSIIAVFITAARHYCEKVQNRSYIDQVWKLTVDGFPSGSNIGLPLGPVSTVASIVYYGTGNTANTMTAGNYYVDTASVPGRVSLAYGEIWPSTTLRPANGVEIQYTTGFGSVASSVPSEVRQAIKLAVGHMYEHREAGDVKPMSPEWIRGAFLGTDSLLWLDRVVPI